MFATVTTWRMAPSIQSDDAQNRVLPELTTRAIAIARTYGILDFVMVPAPPDTLMVISSYETEEDARNSGPPLLTFLTEQYGDTISFVRRQVGPAWEPSDFVSLDRNAARIWRDDASGMFANLNRYQLDQSILDLDQFDAFLQRIGARFLNVLSEMDLLDMLVIRTGDDMYVLRLFENPDAFDRAIERAKSLFTEDPFENKLRIVESWRGRAFDANFLTGT